MNNLEILSHFKITGNVVSVTPFGNGHINKTFKVITDTDDKYLFQCINGYAFHNVDDLMRNIYIVTNYLKEINRPTMEVIKTVNNKLYFQIEQCYYRVYKYIRKTESYEKLESPELITKTAFAFGELHKDLSGLDSCLIAETIKDFHNTPVRFQNLVKAVAEDKYNRVKDVHEMLTFFMVHTADFNNIMDALDSGEIPTRIVHNDPKINNVLFDRETHEVKCVIDLDTVMPGSCLFDFGDALRSIFTGDNESNRDESKLKVDLEAYEYYVKGYFESMGDSLVEKEIELMPRSIATIALELSMRFLEDYLKGDKYFKITFPDENLVRARGQLALAKDVLANIEKLEEITQKYAKGK